MLAQDMMRVSKPSRKIMIFVIPNYIAE